MHRERIAEDVYVFTSNLYAQVTAGAIVTPEGAVVIDTLPFPSETRQILEFIKRRSSAGVRYLILTHYHADHSLGTSLFKGVPVISHARCRDLLAERGASALASAREQNPDLSQVSLRLPDIVFDDGEASVRLGGKTIVLTHLPGHSDDCLAAYLKDDKILFASDVMTPVPMIVDGDPRRLIESLRRIKTFSLENVVQGHGEMILRGEINESVNSNVTYLNRVVALVAGLIHDGQARDALRDYSIESCGKSRIPLHGLVQQFHTANLYALHDHMLSDRDLYKLGLRLLAEREASKTESGRSKTGRTTGVKARSGKQANAGRKTRTQTEAKVKPTARISRQKPEAGALRKPRPPASKATKKPTARKTVRRKAKR
jgi:glyoxylase-like metal-dependent hydrolase (beta-lactamase superfamily II)